MKCDTCHGTGEADENVGEKLRALRLKAGKSLKEVASDMDISTPYLSDLERGNRAWSADRIAQFKKAIA